MVNFSFQPILEPEAGSIFSGDEDSQRCDMRKCHDLSFWAFWLHHFQLTHRQLTHTHTHSWLAHTHTHNILTHTHTRNILTDNLLTHNWLTHTTYSHTQHTHTHATYPQTTYLHTTDSHTTYSHTTCSHTTCPHTTCSHTTYSHITCPHTHTHSWWHRPSLCVAGVALGNIDVHSAWQAWHLQHWAGSGGALGSQWTLLSPRLFAWQAWHLATSTSTLRGRRGTWRHRRAFCVAGVALTALGWLRWRAWATSTSTLRGRRGTWRHRRAFCVAGVALTALGWLRWRAWATSTCTLRGRHGTWRHRPPLCVAGVARGDIDVHSAWQAWHLRHWAGSVARLGDSFVWQAWHVATSTCTLCGRRGTYGPGLARALN